MSFEFPERPLGDATPVKAVPHPVGAVPMPHKRPFGLYRDVFKRVLDLSAILLAAPLVVPIVALAAVAVARDGGSPFYCQQRVGKGGRIFRMWKLRSMVPDADGQLKTILASDPAMCSEWNATQKLRNDPRITKVGRFLRRSSLDELPQLWNVITGDMSLVGPRPMMPDQRALYPGTAYYALRPGITGYWQTAGRNRTTFHARAEYDAIYEESVALRTDLRLLFQTVGVVVNGTGC
ncbi:MAG: sugar transferase [Rhodobacteraceae bacterium]|nr:sugar transferase [Paracoccaceae bacterium]